MRSVQSGLLLKVVGHLLKVKRPEKVNHRLMQFIKQKQ
jgi:hypothetical protein